MGVGLAGPEVEAVGVAGLAGGAAERGGEVVDLGVGGRRGVGVLAHEAVDDAAGAAAAEGAGDVGRSVGFDRSTVGGRGGRLGAEHEGGSELRGRGAGREDGGDPGAVEEPAGGDQRQPGGPGDEAQQSEEAEVLPVAVVEGAAVPARLEALPDTDKCVGCAAKNPPKIDFTKFDLSEASPINSNGFAPND